MKVMKSFKFAVVALAASCLTLAASAQDMTLLGAGSTFVYPLFSKIFSQYTAVKVNYQSIGSGGGILQLTNKTVDFGDSDAPLNDEQTAKMGAPVLHIPMTSGATVIIYNIPGVDKPLNFSGEVIANIYLGKITNWNDPAIKALNKSVSFPDLPIAVVHRSDGSGTSYIFTNYLSKVSPEWKSKVGFATAVNWPVGLGGKGSEGVSGLVKETPGGFGYVELAYAVQSHITYGNVENNHHKFIVPTIASTSLASNIQLPADAKVAITDTDNPNGYPISGFTWALIYKEQNYNGRSKERATALLKLMWYNIHQGQADCAALNYAPLSKSATKVAENILKSATYDGKPIL